VTTTRDLHTKFREDQFQRYAHGQTDTQTDKLVAIVLSPTAVE